MKGVLAGGVVMCYSEIGLQASGEGRPAPSIFLHTCPGLQAALSTHPSTLLLLLWTKLVRSYTTENALSPDVSSPSI